jgi:hypothetical protein
MQSGPRERVRAQVGQANEETGRMIMRTFRTCLIAMLWAISLASAGCSSQNVNCPEVGGVYMPLYTPISGTCGPISNPFPVPLNGGRKGVNMTIQGLPNGMVSTDVVMKGCTLRMTQTVQDASGHPASQLDGDPIYVDSANELSGTVSFMQFTDAGQVACSGMYNARFTKNTTTVGGAAH